MRAQRAAEKPVEAQQKALQRNIQSLDKKKPTTRTYNRFPAPPLRHFADPPFLSDSPLFNGTAQWRVPLELLEF